MRYRNLFLGPIDLQDEPEVNGYVFTIDPLATQSLDHLGPANAEQRAEIRKSWRTWFRRILHAAHVLGVITAVVVAGAVLIGVGLVLGAFNPDLVKGVLR